MSWKEHMSKEAWFQHLNKDVAPLDDPWFWPDDVQPMPREPNEFDPFWR